MADPSTYYWVGGDGNVYARSNQFSGVQNIGRAGATTAGGGTAVLHPNGVTTYVHASADPNPQSPTNTTGNTRGGGGGGGSSGTSAASAAATLAKNETNYHNNLNAANDTINSGIDTQGKVYSQSILDAFNGSGGFKSQQNSINDSALQNELSKVEGMQGVRDMVHNGIQGAGVILDNDGAGTSSAGDAVARAYGIQGRQQASKVGSQYAQGQHTIETNQNNLNNSEDNFMNVDAPANKQKAIYDIVSSAQQSLTYLNAIAAGQSLPDQINIAQQIADVKARATAALTAFDGELASSRAANAPTSQDANQASAMKLFSQGTAPAHEFDFSASVPAQLQNTGPSPSSLPIFVGQNKDNTLPKTA